MPHPPADPAAAELRRLLDIMAALRDPRTRLPVGRGAEFRHHRALHHRGSLRGRRCHPAARLRARCRTSSATCCSRWSTTPGMAEEAGRFGFADVARHIADKMVRRHPHVFGDAAARTRGGAGGGVGASRSGRERAARAETGTLAGIPLGLPALTRAEKLTRRAARVGFDWPDAEAVLEKLDEEVAELRAELRGGGSGAAGRRTGRSAVRAGQSGAQARAGRGALPAGGEPEVRPPLRRRRGTLAAEGRTRPMRRCEEMEAIWQQVKRSA